MTKYANELIMPREPNAVISDSALPSCGLRDTVIYQYHPFRLPLLITTIMPIA